MKRLLRGLFYFFKRYFSPAIFKKCSLDAIENSAGFAISLGGSLETEYIVCALQYSEIKKACDQFLTQEKSLTVICRHIQKGWKIFLSMTGKSLNKDYYRETHIFRPLIERIKKEQVRNIIFDINTATSEDFNDLLMQIFSIFEQQNYHLNLLIFFDNVEYHKFQISFAKYPRIIFIEPLKKWQKHDFVQLWREIYPSSEPNL